MTLFQVILFVKQLYNYEITNEKFTSDHRKNIPKTARALVEDIKTLVAGAASSQEQLAVAAQNAVITIVKVILKILLDFGIFWNNFSIFI